jgi:N6-L-threonylcarbamoyladenine synthase
MVGMGLGFSPGWRWLKVNVVFYPRIPTKPRALVYLLALETSCDETAVALYGGDGFKAHLVHSQTAIHARYGGVVPELASRDHGRYLLPLVERLLGQAGLSAADLLALAVTQGPGLPGALHVGQAFGRGLAYALGIPLIGIHHLEAHLFSAGLGPDPPELPFVALLVSGGHTELVQVEGLGCYRLLGATRDDAAGEAFDKVAQLLELPYPGGPALARLAETGCPTRFRLPRPMLAQPGCEMSFSGLKTAVLHVLRQIREPTSQDRADLAAAFETAVAEVLVEKSWRALGKTGVSRLVVAGGVSANLRLRDALDRRTHGTRVRVYFPPLEFCTDNAAMVAHVAWLRWLAGERTTTDEPVRTRWPLESVRPPGLQPLVREFHA